MWQDLAQDLTGRAGTGPFGLVSWSFNHFQQTCGSGPGDCWSASPSQAKRRTWQVKPGDLGFRLGTEQKDPFALAPGLFKPISRVLLFLMAAELLMMHLQNPRIWPGLHRSRWGGLHRRTKAGTSDGDSALSDPALWESRTSEWPRRGRRAGHMPAIPLAWKEVHWKE